MKRNLRLGAVSALVLFGAYAGLVVLSYDGLCATGFTDGTQPCSFFEHVENEISSFGAFAFILVSVAAACWGFIFSVVSIFDSLVFRHARENRHRSNNRRG
jgi:hypothetical protein